MRYLQVLIGGGAGSLLRYLAGMFLTQHYSGRFPLGTFLINVLGSFLIGAAMASLDAAWRPLLVAGLLGGFTTFSALEWEAFSLGSDGSPGLALLYAAGSLITGFLACWVGTLLVGAARR